MGWYAAAGHGYEDAFPVVGTEERCCCVCVLEVEKRCGERLEGVGGISGEVDQL